MPCVIIVNLSLMKCFNRCNNILRQKISNFVHWNRLLSFYKTRYVIFIQMARFKIWCNWYLVTWSFSFTLNKYIKILLRINLNILLYSRWIHPYEMASLYPYHILFIPDRRSVIAFLSHAIPVIRVLVKCTSNILLTYGDRKYMLRYKYLFHNADLSDLSQHKNSILYVTMLFSFRHR